MIERMAQLVSDYEHEQRIRLVKYRAKYARNLS